MCPRTDRVLSSRTRVDLVEVRRIEMWSRSMLAGVLALSAAFGAVPARAGPVWARRRDRHLCVAVPACIPVSDVGCEVCGKSGTIEYHLVFTPNGGEHSWFNVQNFTGSPATVGSQVAPRAVRSIRVRAGIPLFANNPELNRACMARTVARRYRLSVDHNTRGHPELRRAPTLAANATGGPTGRPL